MVAPDSSVNRRENHLPRLGCEDIPRRSRMPHYLRPLAVVMVASLTTLAATSKPLVFEVSFPRELCATPVDGHIVLILSKDDKQEPRFGIGEGIESQQAFGVDVEGWQPNTVVRVHASILGYPIKTLSDLTPGDYFVQAVLNRYETYHLGNGKDVRLPPDEGEGQHWQTKPGNFLSKVEKLHLDAETSGVIRIAFDHKIQPLEQELDDVETVLDWRVIKQPDNAEDNKWVKHVRMRSELLTQF